MDKQKEKVLETLNRFREAIINNQIEFYKFYIMELFDELAGLKALQIKDKES